MERKVGISIGRLQRVYGDEKALEITASVGADSADLSLEYDDPNDYRVEGSLYSKGDDAVIEYYSKLKEKADSLGIVIGQTHGKLPGFRNIKAEDDALIENTRLDLLATKALGSPVCVIHNATSIFLGPDPDRELMQGLSFDMFSRMLPYAKENGIKIATETFGDAVRYSAVDFFGDINEFETAYANIKAVDEIKDSFTICVDTGHSNKAMRYGNPKPGDVIRRLGKEVTCLHLNDNDTLTDQHKIPLSGTIDWDDVWNALDEIGYNGIYNMECNLAHFGKNLLIDTAGFAVKIMKNILKERYGE